MEKTHWRRAIGRLRPWPVAWAVIICLAVAIIGSNSLSEFASGVVHGDQQTKPTGLPAPHVTSQPNQVCDSPAALAGPPSPPANATVVPAGDDSGFDLGESGTTYWFAPGVHLLGSGQFTQIVPGEGAAFIGAPGAILNGAHVNYYAFGGSASHVTISYLTIENFGSWGGNEDQGVVNHNSSPHWTIEHTTVRDNAGAGVMVGSFNRLSYDCLSDNQQYGFNVYAPAGVSDITIDHNEISGNDTYNWEVHQEGCGCSGGGKFWDVDDAVITNNWIDGNHSVGLWADTDNRGFEIANNYISGNYAYGLIYEISYNAEITGNTFSKNGIGAGPSNPGFPTSAVYISESGGDSRVPGRYSGKLEIADNTFANNWGGVILWENSNRFCNSPANTSSGYCTLVDPGRVTLSSCNSSNIEREPYYDDCRWKTQNVSVDHNVFDFAPASVSANCTAATECGFQGVFSEYGTYPSWSPYTGPIVEKHITYDQGNSFFDNQYNGPWQFMVYQQGNVVSWQSWNSAPYNLDKGSVVAGPLR